MEIEEGKAVDYSIPKGEGKFDQEDALCKMMEPEIEWEVPTPSCMAGGMRKWG
jgi:hypothetical protein